MKENDSVFQVQTAETVLDLVGESEYSHPFLHHDLAGKAHPLFASLSQVELNAAILAVFVPAEAPVGNVFRGEELHTPQQGVVLGNLERASVDFDLH